MDRALAALVTCAALTYAWCVHPARARCPAGHDLRTGIRRDGHFECWPAVVGDPLYDGAAGYPERGRQSDAILTGRIYCTGGTQPIIVDYRTVGCQRDFIPPKSKHQE